MTCACSASVVEDCDGTHEPNCPMALDWEEPFDGTTREGRIVKGDRPADQPWKED